MKVPIIKIVSVAFLNRLVSGLAWAIGMRFVRTIVSKDCSWEE